MMTLHNPARRAAIIICEYVTRVLASTLGTAPAMRWRHVVVAVSSVVVGTVFWAYLFMGRVVLNRDVLVVRWFKRVSLPVVEIQAVSADEGLLRPAVETKDRRRVFLTSPSNAQLKVEVGATPGANPSPTALSPPGRSEWDV